MPLPSAPGAGSVRLLILTAEYTDFLWLESMLLEDPELMPDAVWCPDLVDCDDLIRNASFDVIVWDCVLHGSSETAFLQYLCVASDDKPVLAMSAEPCSEKAETLIGHGAADYLCLQSLDRWNFCRAVKYLWYRECLSESTRAQRGREAHMAADMRVEEGLRRALRAGELELYYQPRIDLATEEVRGVECLLRWNHPERGLVMPDQFIPAAERSGLIVRIGYWVIEQACRRLQECQEQGLPAMVFAVNLSFRQFHDRKMTETIFRIIFNSNIDTSLLELELTESAMMHDPDYAQRCLRELNQLGISFALDDFGTGFSSLSNLQHLPISLVKIDKSFVQDLGESADAEHIIRAIISLAHSLRISVVAEGVETEGQLEFLRHQHCDEIQGYYYARPMPWQDLVQFVDQQNQFACLQN